MLRSTLFPPRPYTSLPLLTRSATTTCHSLPPARAVQFQLQQFRQPRLILRAARGAAASPKRRGRGGKRKDEDEFEYESDEDEEYDDEEEGEEEDDGEEGMIPLEQMRKWFSKKPKGFGEGKEYDTSVEDKLLDEMRQSREAQAANLAKLKNNPVKTDDSDKKKKDSQVVLPIGGRVRLVNLPKKKNIHRDLKAAFEGIPGITNIVPAVTGNKKTRDPICKGFAFVDFKREADAVRFVELYSGQTLTFGKNQKPIKCELVNISSNEEDLKAAPLELRKNLKAAPRLMVSAVEEDPNEDSNTEDSAPVSWDEDSNLDDSDDADNQIYGEEEEFIRENQDFAAALTVDYDDSAETGIDSEINSLSLEQANENPAGEQKSPAKAKQVNARKKKQTPKEKAKKVSKLDVPGSAKRLRIKEKAVLSDVFSKYGSKAALASKER